MYKNIQINEAVTTAIGIIDTCYIQVVEVGSVEGFASLEAYYMVRVFKDKASFEESENNYINVPEIQNFTRAYSSEFLSDTDLFTKISQEVINELLEKNPNWTSENLIIESIKI